MKFTISIAILSSALCLTACTEGDLFDDVDQTTSDVNTANVGSRQVALPEEFSVDEVSDDLSFFYYGEEEETAQENSVSTRSTVSYYDIAGVIVERDLEVSEVDASSILDNIVDRIESESIAETPWPDLSQTTDSLSRISLYNLTESYSAVVASYNLVTTEEYSIIEVANSLSQIFSYQSDSGLPSDTLTETSSTDPVSTEFRVFIAAYYLDDDPDQAFLLSTVIRESVYENYITENNRGVSPSNVVSSNASFSTGSNNFTAESGSDMADFLFVIDNSGSMSDEQTAIAQVASDFESTVSNSGLDFRIATITTDRSTLQDSNSDGGITTDMTEYAQDVQPGTGGSSTESAIYYAEQALLSTDEGDSTDGSLALVTESEPMPRSGASMNIIMMSDEPDQYSSKAGSTFDVDSNLFVERGYIVHAIVVADSTYSDSNGQYDELATATGGLEGDITNLTSFNQMMVDITTLAGAASSSFELTNYAISETISVTMDGISVPRSQENGWDLPVGTNSIVFYGTYLPVGGESIEVVYSYLSE